MLFFVKHLIALAPFSILITNIVAIMIIIISKRNHFISFVATIISFLLSFLSLFWLYKISPIYITELIYINFYSIIYIGITIFISIITVIFSYVYLKKFFHDSEEFYLLLTFSLIGAILLITANHIFSIFIGIELMSFPILGLMIYSIYQNKILQTTLKYLILSSIATLFMLLGIGIIYAQCGSFNLNNIKIILLISGINNNPLLLIGIGLLIVSLFFKLSLFPLHFWMTDVYQNISPVLLIYFTTAVKVAVFSVLIKFFSYLPFEFSQPLYLFVKYIAIFSIIFGSIMNLFQKNIGKFFGYSAIVHMGYLIVILLFLKNYHFCNTISIVYLINYVLSTIGIFSILSFLLIYKNKINSKSSSISLYKGLFWKQPICSIVMTISLFSLLGIPLTLGFIAKFFIVYLVIYKKLWLILCAMLINSGLGVYYYLRIVLNIYSKDYCDCDFKCDNFYLCAKILIFFVGFLVVFFGIFPSYIINLINIYC